MRDLAAKEGKWAPTIEPISMGVEDVVRREIIIKIFDILAPGTSACGVGRGTLPVKP